MNTPLGSGDISPSAGVVDPSAITPGLAPQEAAFAAEAVKIFDFKFSRESTSMLSPVRERAVTEARDHFTEGDRHGGWDNLEGSLARIQGDGQVTSLWTDQLRDLPATLFDARHE